MVGPSVMTLDLWGERPWLQLLPDLRWLWWSPLYPSVIHSTTSCHQASLPYPLLLFLLGCLFYLFTHFLKKQRALTDADTCYVLTSSRKRRPI